MNKEEQTPYAVLYQVPDMPRPLVSYMFGMGTPEEDARLREQLQTLEGARDVLEEVRKADEHVSNNSWKYFVRTPDGTLTKMD